MEDNACSALSLWNDWIIDRPDAVASKMAMSGQQMVLKAAVIDGNNVCEELSLFPVLGQWDGQNPSCFGTNVAWVGKNISEKISHEGLDTVLPLCTCTLVQGIVCSSATLGKVIITVRPRLDLRRVYPPLMAAKAGNEGAVEKIRQRAKLRSMSLIVWSHRTTAIDFS